MFIDCQKTLARSVHRRVVKIRLSSLSRHLTFILAYFKNFLKHFEQDVDSAQGIIENNHLDFSKAF